MNAIATKHCKDGHNCLMLILIYLEEKFANFCNEITENEHSQTPPNNNNDKNKLGTNIEENCFFDSLNSKNSSGGHYISKDRKNKILPSTFTTLEDIKTTQTQLEIAQQDEYKVIDERIICPKMCGAVWGKDGHLIYFSNILIKSKKSKQMQLEQQRNNMQSLHDYNEFIEHVGANNVHSDALHSIRKRVFGINVSDMLCVCVCYLAVWCVIFSKSF